MSIKAMDEAAMLDVWAADQRLIGIRNYALLRMMIYTGGDESSMLHIHPVRVMRSISFRPQRKANRLATTHATQPLMSHQLSMKSTHSPTVYC